MNKGTRLQQLLSVPVQHHPDNTAIIFDNECVSYAKLDVHCRRVAAGLLRLDIKPGDRVALMLPNCLEAVYSTIACYIVGAIVVPINYRNTAAESRYVLEKTRPALLIVHPDKLEIYDSLEYLLGPDRIYVTAGQQTQSKYPFFADLQGFDAVRSNSGVSEDAPALLLYTSGSTGHPKGVVHSHRSAYAGIDISRRVFEFDRKDVVLVGKPISHAGGLQTQLMPSLNVGAKVILAMRPSPAQAIWLIQHHQVTQYAMLASRLVDFIEYLEEIPARLPSLANSIGSGDAVPIDLHHRFRDLFGWQVMEGCGMTEIGGYYAANPRRGRRKWGSMGVPCPDTELQIIDDDGKSMGIGEVGEIAVKTPSATIGYWKDDENTRNLFDGDWLRTGDLAKFDDQGFIWFVARKKLIIVRCGSNISPAEVESVIDEHPLIHASVVVGIPDRHDGQVPVAWVLPLHGTEGPNPEALKAYVSEHLAAYKTPRVLFLSERIANQQHWQIRPA